MLCARWNGLAAYADVMTFTSIRLHFWQTLWPSVCGFWWNSIAYQWCENDRWLILLLRPVSRNRHSINWARPHRTCSSVDNLHVLFVPRFNLKYFVKWFFISSQWIQTSRNGHHLETGIVPGTTICAPGKPGLDTSWVSPMLSCEEVVRVWQISINGVQFFKSKISIIR